MKSLRTLALAAVTTTFGLVGCAQTPVARDARQTDGAPAAAMTMPMPMGGTGAPMARMDEQMKSMQAMHEKMMQARTPDQRSALMAEHMKLMQDSMAMMGGMKDKPAMGGEKGGTHGMQGMQGMQGKSPMDADMNQHHQMMDKRMQMMQSMMQMMMDRMPPAPARP